jgi:hypothetical protein
MAEQLFVEDLMQRIRSLVRAEANGFTPGESATEGILLRLRQRIPVAMEEAVAVRQPAVAHEMPELSAINAELEACVSASAMVGEINPRHPSVANDRIQSVKRLMRRSLGWYTRPLRLFHGAVIRALQNLTAAVEKQQRSLEERVRREELLETNRRVDDVEVGTCQLHELAKSAIDTSIAGVQSVKDELAELREDVCKLRTELTATRQQLKEARAEFLAAKGMR